MSSILQQLQAQANQAAEVADDMREEQKGGGGRLLPAGVSLAYLTEVIEFGEHPQEFNGKPKGFDAREFRLGFQLLNPAFANEDGSCPTISTYDLAESRNAKANTFKLFKAMNWRSSHSRFAQMIGELFIVKVVHKTNEQTKKTSARLDMGSISPPIDAATGGTYAAPKPLDEKALRLLLWDNPTIEGWNSIHIEGTFDNGDSKNFLQNKCLSAVDFEGSALQSVLLANNVAYKIPVKKDKTEAAVPAAATPATPSEATVAAPAAAPVATPTVAPAPVAVPAVAPAAIPLSEVPFEPDLPVQQ